MSRETEKLLKELQRFLDSSTDEAADETTVNALAEQFLTEYDQKCRPERFCARNCRRLSESCGTGTVQEKAHGISP